MKVRYVPLYYDGHVLVIATFLDFKTHVSSSGWRSDIFLPNDSSLAVWITENKNSFLFPVVLIGLDSV